MKKECPFIFLPTEEPTNIYSFKGIINYIGGKPQIYKGESIGQHLYILSDDILKVGDWCMFYNQLSKVLEVNEFSVKIETITITSKDDAEFINSIKGKDVVKEGEPGKMVHSFNIKQLPKIIGATNPDLWGIADEGVAEISREDIKYIIALHNTNQDKKWKDDDMKEAFRIGKNGYRIIELNDYIQSKKGDKNIVIIEYDELPDLQSWDEKTNLCKSIFEPALKDAYLVIVKD